MMMNMDSRKFFVCRCFYTNNIYSKNYDTHFTFVNKQQFTRDYDMILKQKGCRSTTDVDNLIQEIEDEINRRRNLGRDYLQRKMVIREKYRPLHPQLYELKEEFLAPDFLSLVEDCKLEIVESRRLVEDTHVSRVYSLPMFTEEFCKMLIEEIAHFEKSEFPKGRPNTMNKYGVLLDELGFDEKFIGRLRKEYIMPVTRILFPDCGGDSLDSHKAFVVKYKPGEDLDLGYHYDNSEVTLNISLGSEFTGGSLFFGDMRTVPITETECSEVSHRQTFGLIHRGQHMHGALSVRCGERYNLIIWMRSSKVRNQICPMCNALPSLVETDGFGDGFTEQDELVNICAIY